MVSLFPQAQCVGPLVEQRAGAAHARTLHDGPHVVFFFRWLAGLALLGSVWSRPQRQGHAAHVSSHLWTPAPRPTTSAGCVHGCDGDEMARWTMDDDDEGSGWDESHELRRGHKRKRLDSSPGLFPR